MSVLFALLRQHPPSKADDSEIRSNVLQRSLADIDGIVVVPEQQLEAVVAEAEKVINVENLVRTAILSGMSPKEAYLKHGKVQAFPRFPFFLTRNNRFNRKHAVLTNLVGPVPPSSP